MTVHKLIDSAHLNPISVNDGEREIVGAYVGDLLSWVMGRAEADNVWITIMSNTNIVAVATLAGVGCILLSEGVTLDKEVIKLASDKGINVFSTELASYDAAIKVSGLI